MPTRGHLRESLAKGAGDLVDPPTGFERVRGRIFCRFFALQIATKGNEREKERERGPPPDKRRGPKRDGLRCAKIKEWKEERESTRAARQGGKRKGKSVDGGRAHARVRVCGRSLFRDERERSNFPK